MDPNNASQLPLPTSTTGPQIRSRITVVCAECKRLKLKCDRRTPCGSCTKRDTVVRCIYSPAAAEKVDLHSLNNRLIQVESTLAMVTAGQAPPAFQSSYPFSHPSSSSSCAQPLPASFPHSTGSHHHHHHHHAAAYSPENDSLALSAEDLTSIWLDDLDLGLSPSPQVPQSHMQNSGYIKLEPSPTDIELTQPQHGMIIIDPNSAQRSGQAPRTTTPFKQLDAHQQQAQHYLPPLSIYHPAPAMVPPSPSGTSSPYPSTPSYTFPQYTHPQITSPLLSLLPPFARCSVLFRNAEEVFRMRPIPFYPKGGWKAFKRKCLAVLSGPLASERERDAARQQREARKAKAVYYHGGQAPPDDDIDGVGGVWSQDGGGETSLAFFACMCAVLAVGAHAVPPSRNAENPGNSPAFLYALSQQALGVWETHASSAGVEEPERMDCLLASIVGTVYQLYSRSTSSGGEEDGGSLGAAVSPLVGKMYNVARLMGLGRDVGRRKSAKSKSRGKEREREEMRRMVWWDVLFYDLFTSDIVGQPPLAPSFTYTTRLPACASAEEDEESEQDSHDDDEDAELDPALSGEMYFGVRCRLTQLAQTIKHRTATPDCCCGYTLDQAAALDSDVRRFIDRLPAALRLSTALKESEDSSMMMDSPSLEPREHPDRVDKERTTLLVQSAELVIIANLLIWKIYVPFLRPASSSSSSPSQTKSSGSWHSASQATVTAAQEILSAAKVLLNAKVAIPTIFDFYPLGKVVFDATIVCAHASLTTKYNDNDLEALLAAGLEGASKLNDRFEWRKTVLFALTKRLAAGNQSRGAASLKRKRSHLHAGLRGSLGATGQVGDGIQRSSFDAPLYPNLELPPPSAPATAFPPPQQSPPTTQRSRESLSTPPISRSSGSTPGKSGTGEKDKKHAKKTHVYPSVGIRIRTKDGSPLVRSKAGSETTANNDGGRERGKMQAPPPLMTSTPRMMPRESAAANTYQPQPSPVHTSQQKPLMLTMNNDSYRSRSSSLSHVQTAEPSQQQSHPLDYPSIPYSEYRMREQQMASPQPFDSSPPMFNHSQPQPQQQLQSTMYDLAPQHGYDQRQQHASSYDRAQDSSASYASAAPSPCPNPTNTPMSSTSSPYTSPSGSAASGQPPTPTLTFGSRQRPSPPAFVHQSGTTSSTSASSPTGFFHLGTPFEPGYETSSGSGMSMAGLRATIEQAVIGSSVPSTPVTYERPQLHPMYDVKPPPMDALVPPHAYDQLHSHQVHQQDQFHRGHVQPGDTLPPPPPSYSDPHQQLSHQHHGMSSVEGERPSQAWPPPAPSATQAFWNSSGDFNNKFYP